MKKTILPLMAVSLFLINPAFSAAAEAPYDFKKCADAATADPNKCKSTAKRFREAKAKCNAMTDAAQKEECLKVLEEKAAKRRLGN